MGSSLRLLILTDYIRKEYEKAIGNPEATIASLGVLPFLKCSVGKTKSSTKQSGWAFYVEVSSSSRQKQKKRCCSRPTQKSNSRFPPSAAFRKTTT